MNQRYSTTRQKRCLFIFCDKIFLRHHCNPCRISILNVMRQHCPMPHTLLRTLPRPLVLRSATAFPLCRRSHTKKAGACFLMRLTSNCTVSVYLSKIRTISGCASVICFSILLAGNPPSHFNLSIHYKIILDKIYLSPFLPQYIMQ
jgi:hypothetical protein